MHCKIVFLFIWVLKTLQCNKLEAKTTGQWFWGTCHLRKLIIKNIYSSNFFAAYKQQSVWLKLTMWESIPSHLHPFKVYLPHLFSYSYLVNSGENPVFSNSMWSPSIICGFSLKTLLIPEVLFSEQKSKVNCSEISWYRNFWILFALPSSLKIFVFSFSIYRYDCF